MTSYSKTSDNRLLKQIAGIYQHNAKNILAGLVSDMAQPCTNQYEEPVHNIPEY